MVQQEQQAKMDQLDNMELKDYLDQLVLKENVEHKVTPVLEVKMV